MSGGSYDYAYRRVEDMADRLAQSRNALRRAFAGHLYAVAKAMHDVEWVDSADYAPGAEGEAIEAVLSPGAEIEAAIEAGNEALAALGAAIARATEAT